MTAVTAVDLPQLTRRQARQMVQRIHAAARDVHKSATRWHVLLVEAHRAQIHVTLGHESWERFAVDALGMSAANAYRALDRGKVAELLESQGISDPAALVSGRQAAVLARQLPQAANEIASAVRKGVQPKKAVREAVARRQPVKRPEPKKIEPPKTTTAKSASADVEMLRAVVRELTSTPVADAAAVYSAEDMAKLARWSHDVYDAITKSKQSPKRAASKRRSASSSASKSSSCVHPANRRLGDYCAACDSTVKS